MITLKDQEQLFTLIASTISKDLSCYAFGGTAMMFYGFKDETKDIDLLFEQENERQEFVKALQQLGYQKRSLDGIYIPKKLRDLHAPLVYRREENRFDLFVEKIFQTMSKKTAHHQSIDWWHARPSGSGRFSDPAFSIEGNFVGSPPVNTPVEKADFSPRMKEEVFAVHEFKSKHTLKINVLRTEQIVLLKAVTDRQNDFDDIKSIIKKDTHFDWQYLIDEVLWQYQHGDSWVLLDTEKMLQELKKYVFIPEKYFNQLYTAEKKC